MKQPFFSIVVPIYKVEKYLHQCIDSLLNQDFNDYEIILVDDGSPDLCPKICDEYATKDSKIKVIHKPNGGLSDARNAGIAIAEGKYITFVDSDDFWRGNDILTGVSEIIKNNKYPDIIVSDFIKYYEQNNKYLEPSVICPKELNSRTKQEVLEYLYFYQTDMKMSACQKFTKYELLTTNTFEEGLLSEDIDWSLKIYPLAESIAFYNKPYYCYRQQREGSITNTASLRSFDSLIYILDKWKNEIPKLRIPNAEKSIYLGYLAYQLTICMIIYGKLDMNMQKDAIKRLHGHEELFNNKLNRKSIPIKYLVQILGMKNTCKILGLFIRLRSTLKRG